MANFRSLVHEGAGAWNAARLAEPEARPDLTGLSLSRFADDPDLSAYDLSGAVLRNAVLSKLHLTHADLTGADCRGMQLSGLSLDNATLVDADFRNARFYNCFFRHADLRGTNFAGALFQGADFEDALVGGTDFGNSDLRHVSSLDRVTHCGPVIIGIGGLQASDGRVPRSFLEKAGVSDGVVRLMARWARRRVVYHKCFISYAEEDAALVRWLRDQLVNAGVRHVFVASRDIRPGQHYPDVIRNTIYGAGRVIVVLSRHALRSDWVGREITMAVEASALGPTTVIPLARISPAEWDRTTVGWARQLRQSTHAVGWWRLGEAGRKSALSALQSALRYRRTTANV